MKKILLISLLFCGYSKPMEVIKEEETHDFVAPEGFILRESNVSVRFNGTELLTAKPSVLYCALRTRDFVNSDSIELDWLNPELITYINLTGQANIIEKALKLYFKCLNEIVLRIDIDSPIDGYLHYTINNYMLQRFNIALFIALINKLQLSRGLTNSILTEIDSCYFSDGEEDYENEYNDEEDLDEEPEDE